MRFQDVTTLLAPGGQPYAPSSVDPEGLVLTKDRELILTSEGLANNLIDPFVRRYALNGSFVGSLPLPRPFLTTADQPSGVRQNLGFESAGVPPNGRVLFTATENAQHQDGPAATIANGSPARILRYNLQTGRLDRQWVYETDAVARPPVPATQFSVNGLVELLPLNNEFLVAMERSFSVGAPGTGNTIKLYDVALSGATVVNGVDSLPGRPHRIRPARKTRLLKLDDLGIPLDNVEGLTFGPRLRDGRQSLVLVGDDNLAATHFTQFPAVRVREVALPAAYQAELAGAYGSCGASSRTTGTTKAWLTGRRRAGAARRVMVGVPFLAAGLARAARRGAFGLVCGGVHEVDQRGVHDTGNPPTRVPRFSGGWQACHRCRSRLARCGSRPPAGCWPHF